MDACRACLWLHYYSNASCDVDCICRSAVTAAAVAVLQVARRRAVYLASADIRCHASIITVSCVNDLGRNRRNSGRSTCLFIMIAFAATSRDVWLASRYLWYKTGKFTGIHWWSPRDTCLVLRRFKTRFNVCVWAVFSRPSRPCLLCVPAFHCHVVVQLTWSGNDTRLAGAQLLHRRRTQRRLCLQRDWRWQWHPLIESLRISVTSPPANPNTSSPVP